MLHRQLTRLLCRFGVAIAALCLFVAVGMAVTHLTVHDNVAVSPAMRNCVKGVSISLDHPLERLGLVLGKIKIIEARPTSAQMKIYTIYRIPLGLLRGQPDVIWGVNCTFVNPLPPDVSASVLVD